MFAVKGGEAVMSIPNPAFCRDWPDDPMCQRIYTAQAVAPQTPITQPSEELPSVGGFVLLIAAGLGIWQAVRWQQKQQPYPELPTALLPPPPSEYLPYPIQPSGQPTYTEHEMTERLADLEYELTKKLDPQPWQTPAPVRPPTQGSNPRIPIESAQNQVPNQDRISPESGTEFSIDDPESDIEFGCYCDLVEDGMSPKGNPILLALWGIKPGNSDRYAKARERRNQYAERLKDEE